MGGVFFFMSIGNMSNFDITGKISSPQEPSFLHSPFVSETPHDNWRDCFPELIGRSPAMQKMLQIIYKVAKSDSSVLIHGDSGTGKELIASAIHRLSPRSAKRFVPINCSAIPENLLESELFGHEKGAFTGATAKRIGHFQMAHGGTIFLDEIGDMASSLQAKLLRVLQEKKFSPIGSNELVNADVRVIAATNVDLQKAVAQNSFRLDLFYRLNVLPIYVPPLREREEDISQLLDHFLEVSNSRHGTRNPCFLDDSALQSLQYYPWPGNVRELENLVERLVVITGGGRITADMLPPEYRSYQEFAQAQARQQPQGLAWSAPSGPFKSREYAAARLPESGTAPQSILDENYVLPPEGINLIEAVERLENNLIMQALQRCENNKNQAAKLLGLNRTTLVERIKKRKLIPLNAPSQEL
jgi:transcriptional regulator with GAF, ATPase, and Fis domain